MENSWLLLALLYTAALILFSKIVESRRRPERKLPPGPKPWPIIGNLNLVGSISSPIIPKIRQNHATVVIASSPEMAEQFLRVHGTNFASRPALAAYNYSNMTWAPYGPYWRQARKIYLNTKKLEFFEPIRVEEMRNFLSRLHSLSSGNVGKPVVLRQQLSRYTLSSISRMVLGNKYFSESENGVENSVFKLEELQQMLEEWFLLNGAINIGDWIPWLNFLDLQGYVKRMKSLCKNFDRFNEYVIDDHEARRLSENDEIKYSKDVVDMLLQLAEDPNLEVKLTRDCIKGLFQVSPN